MYINLDHSPSVASATAGVDAGFEFIHIDLSQARKDASDDDIIRATRAVVDYAAAATGALVESEPHYFGGSSNVHHENIDYEDIRKTFPTPKAPPPLSQPLASTPSPQPSGTCTASTQSSNGSISIYCNRSAMRSM
jgi:hypothetical protein